MYNFQRELFEKRICNDSFSLGENEETMTRRRKTSVDPEKW